MNASQGSYIEAIIPWMVEEMGYETKIKGQLMLLDATTSMPFRSLIECETLEVSCRLLVSNFETFTDHAKKCTTSL